MDKQEVWNSVYYKARNKLSPSLSMKIADSAIDSYKEPIGGVRSMAVNSNFVEDGDILDVLVGYVDSGAEEGLDDSLDSSGFDNFEEKDVKADLEHFNSDFADGKPNSLDDKWHDFLIPSKMYKKGNEIRAKIEPPKNELGQEFVENYKNGKFGASIEYKGYKENDKVVDWEITGFSFTNDPHYNQTKPKNSKN